MIAERMLVDAGPLVAILSRHDQHHSRCVEVTKRLPAVLLTCWPAITEAAYLLRGSPRGVQALLSRIETGKLGILPLGSDDMAGVREILSRFSDQDFDFADACLMHLADREAIHHVFTLDRRHFSVFRKTNGEPLDVLPQFD